MIISAMGAKKWFPISCEYITILGLVRISSSINSNFWVVTWNKTPKLHFSMRFLMKRLSNTLSLSDEDIMINLDLSVKHSVPPCLKVEIDEASELILTISLKFNAAWFAVDNDGPLSSHTLFSLRSKIITNHPGCVFYYIPEKIHSK